MKKILAVALLTIFVVSSLGFAVVAADAPESSGRGWGWNIASLMKQSATFPFKRSWVRLNGIAETWGSEEVNGSLSVNTRTVVSDEDVDGAAFVTAIWINTADSRERGNFSYSFYAARLVKVEVSKLDFEGADFFLNGTWNVVNVTITQTITKSGDAESGYTVDRQTKTDVDPIVTRAYGELRVNDNWKEFMLSIKGTADLGGVVARTRMTQMTFNKFKVGEDDNDKVSRVDLKALAKNYGANPGWGSYDSNMDFNGNYRIDIADLATVAAHVQNT